MKYDREEGSDWARPDRRSGRNRSTVSEEEVDGEERSAQGPD